MINNHINDEHEYEESTTTDVIIQETPIAGNRTLPFHRAKSDITQITKLNNINDSSAKDNYDNSFMEKIATSPTRHINDFNIREISATSLKNNSDSHEEFNTQDINCEDNSVEKTDSNSVKSYNRRTPDIERISKFFKDRRSPGKNLLAKFQQIQDEQDTDEDHSEDNNETQETSTPSKSFEGDLENPALPPIDSKKRKSELIREANQSNISVNISNIKQKRDNETKTHILRDNNEGKDEKRENNDAGLESYKRGIFDVINNSIDEEDTPLSQRISDFSNNREYDSQISSPRPTSNELNRTLEYTSNNNVTNIENARINEIETQNIVASPANSSNIISLEKDNSLVYQDTSKVASQINKGTNENGLRNRLKYENSIASKESNSINHISESSKLLPFKEEADNLGSDIQATLSFTANNRHPEGSQPLTIIQNTESNSSKPTQLINNDRTFEPIKGTQEIDSQSRNASIIREIDSMNAYCGQQETQLINVTSTQNIHSQSRIIYTSDFEKTRPTQPADETSMQVPATSSPSKGYALPDTNNTSSPNITQEDQKKENIGLKVSHYLGNASQSDFTSKNASNTSLVMSDVDATQELPELEEDKENNEKEKENNENRPEEKADTNDNEKSGLKDEKEMMVTRYSNEQSRDSSNNEPLLYTNNNIINDSSADKETFKQVSENDKKLRRKSQIESQEVGAIKPKLNKEISNCTKHFLEDAGQDQDFRSHERKKKKKDQENMKDDEINTQLIHASDGKSDQLLSNTFKDTTNFDESQPLVIGRRSRRKYKDTFASSDEEITKKENQIFRKLTIKNEEEDYSDIKTEKEMHNAENTTRNSFPTEIRTKDESYLSKNDINFENAVWCSWGSDCKYYPAILLSDVKEDDTCKVLFESGLEIVKTDDVYYLDIRVGDVVSFQGNSYKVIALECKYPDLSIIRCVRGYDTVYLRKKRRGDTSTKEPLMTTLASICIEVNYWTKRAKLASDRDVSNKRIAHQDLRHPIRGRKPVNSFSPRKAETPMTPRGIIEKTSSDLESSQKKVMSESNTSNRTLISNTSHSSKEYTPIQQELKMKSHTNISMSSSFYSSSKLFNGCLFVLTGFGEADEKKLYHTITENGGGIVNDGASTMFNFERIIKSDRKCKQISLNLQLKNEFANADFRFVGLLAGHHMRSSKYLEMLSLRWPTLHWTFIQECIRRNNFQNELILSHLLAAGETSRFNPIGNNKKSVMKSHNIFNFYLGFIQRLTIKNQLNAMKEMMPDYSVILCGNSKINNLVKFLFACLGVKDLYHLEITNRNIKGNEALLESIFKDVEIKKGKLLIYLNEIDENSLPLLKVIEERIERNFASSPVFYHVEWKEWLLQTVITESTGYQEE